MMRAKKSSAEVSKKMSPEMRPVSISKMVKYHHTRGKAILDLDGLHYFFVRDRVVGKENGAVQ